MWVYLNYSVVFVVQSLKEKFLKLKKLVNHNYNNEYFWSILFMMQINY